MARDGESEMASSKEKTTKATRPKATPAGPKRRSATKAAQPATPPVAEARPHLRAVEAVVVEAAAPAEPAQDGAAQDGRFRRSDLLEAVCARSAVKRAEARQLVELVLEELGLALDRKDELMLPPLGKLSVKRRKPDAEGPDMLTLKLRRPGPATDKAGESPLADPDEDG